MGEAALLGCRLFDHILKLLRPGLREIDVAAELEYEARRLGAEGMSFETIVASGPRSALPHGRATTARLPRRGFLTLDFGVILNGYCSDMTRTIHFGTPKREGTQCIRKGVGGAAVGGGGRRGGCELRRRGRGGALGVARGGILADAFSHSTGHGVGLEIHEPPRVGTNQANKLLARHGGHDRAGDLHAGSSSGFALRIWWP